MVAPIYLYLMHLQRTFTPQNVGIACKSFSEITNEQRRITLLKFCNMLDFYHHRFPELLLNTLMLWCIFCLFFDHDKAACSRFLRRALRRILPAKMENSFNKKEENNVASQSELEIIQLFPPFSCLYDWKRYHWERNCFKLQNG